MKFLVTFSLIIFTHNFIFAASKKYVAAVDILKGHVTVLEPGSHIARKLKKGDKLKEDSSIVTQKSSFIKVKFFDNSVLSVGPESKMVIVTIPKNDAGVVSLLKGKIRSKINKSNTGKEKFFIQTRTAAMGVRGTDFQTIFNPDNRVTSLVTFEGEVAMVKIDENEKAIIKSDKIDVKNIGSKNVQIIKEPISSKDTIAQLKSKFKQDTKKVLVKQGQFSGTVEKMKTVSQPVKLNPVQLNILYKNEKFETKKSIETVKAASIDPSKEKLLIKAAEQEVPPEGIIDTKKGIYAPKAGGFIDLDSGLYVPPAADSTFDKKSGVFVSEKVGVIDEKTGQYVAPKGLKLDSEKGFVIDEAKISKNEQSLLLAKAENLNTTMAKDVIVGVPEEKTIITFTPFNNKELVARNSLLVSLYPHEQVIAIKKDSLNPHHDKFRSEKSHITKFEWNQSGNGKFQSHFSFLIKDLNFNSNDLNQIEMKDSKYYGLYAGAKMSLSPRLSASLKFGIDQEYFLNHSVSTTSTTHEFVTVALPKLLLYLDSVPYQNGRFSMILNSYLGTNAGKRKGPMRVEPGFHFGLKTGGKYWFTKSSSMSFAFNHQNERYEVKGIGGESYYVRESSGLDFSFDYIF